MDTKITYLTSDYKLIQNSELFDSYRFVENLIGSCKEFKAKKWISFIHKQEGMIMKYNIYTGKLHVHDQVIWKVFQEKYSDNYWFIKAFLILLFDDYFKNRDSDLDLEVTDIMPVEYYDDDTELIESLKDLVENDAFIRKHYG